MNKLIPLAILLFSLGCALPQSQSEASKWFRTSDHVVKNEFFLKGTSLKSAETRMRAFSKKCLEKKVIYTDVKRAEVGATQNSPSSTFRPKIVKNGQSVSLYLQRYAPKLNMVGTPDDGRYDFFAEAQSVKGGDPSLLIPSPSGLQRANEPGKNFRRF